MKRVLLLITLCTFLSFFSAAQVDGDFQFGGLSTNELQMEIYASDSSAKALVLNEFGSAHINLDSDYYYNLYYYYHRRVKILKKEGFDQATVEIQLNKGKRNGLPIKEVLSNLKASVFNVRAGRKTEMKFDPKNVYIEDKTHYDVLKFTLPNIEVGSILEYSYSIESPYYFNFRSWYFQEGIPKVYSEYWAQIPGTHTYNIALRGFFNLTKNDFKKVDRCIVLGSGEASCIINKYGMKDIPAFVEEDYMVAKKNFLSAIYFELREFKSFSGRVDLITKEWKDADEELKQWDKFGGQIKRGKYNFWQERLTSEILSEKDDLNRSVKVYNFIRDWYTWNDAHGFLCDNGIKKAFDKKVGDVSEINLSLISALRFVGIEAQPVILSTRDAGIPTDLFPVLSEFNYVIANCKINGREYFLDATERYLPFGMLPMRCLNGRGRLISTDFKSEWVEIPNKNKSKVVSIVTLKLSSEGTIKGNIQNSYIGYDAFAKRKEIMSYNSIEEYVEKLNENNDKIKIVGFDVENIDQLDSVLLITLQVEVKEIVDLAVDRLFLEPYSELKWKQNPFKSKERLYPVDFGVPIERHSILQLELPDNFHLTDFPDRIALALPNNGGRYLMDVQGLGNKVTWSNLLTISRPIYSSQEYYYLKELFNKVIQSENSNFVFEKK